MKKKFITLFGVIFLVALSAFFVLKENQYMELDISKEITHEAEMDLRIDSIRLVMASNADGFNDLYFDLYLDRPDLNLVQPENAGNMLTVDLEPGLQPKYMYVSEVEDLAKDTGNICDRPRFPHECRYAFTEGKRLDGPQDLLVKVLFEDGGYAQKQVSVSVPEVIESAVITEPEKTPAQGGKFTMKFRDVGADKYEVGVYMCNEYQNDGINPCLDNYEFSLVKKKDNFVLEDDYWSDLNLQINKEGGSIVINSNIELFFEESMQYTVKAIVNSVSENKIPMSAESFYSKVLKK